MTPIRCDGPSDLLRQLEAGSISAVDVREIARGQKSLHLDVLQWLLAADEDTVAQLVHDYVECGLLDPARRAPGDLPPPGKPVFETGPCGMAPLAAAIICNYVPALRVLHELGAPMGHRGYRSRWA